MNRAWTDQESFAKGVGVLVLSRRKGQRIIIGDGDAKITILVIDNDPKFVRLGIEAPQDVNVLREEIYLAVKRAGVDLSRRVIPEGDGIA